MISGAGRAARRVALLVSDGRSRVPVGARGRCAAGGTTASRPSGRRSRPSRRASTRRASARPGRGGRRTSSGTAFRLRPRARPARASSGRACPRRHRRRRATGSARTSAEASPSRTGHGARRASQTPAPSVRSNPAPTRGTSGRTARSSTALSTGAPCRSRAAATRHRDASADEQEHADRCRNRAQSRATLRRYPACACRCSLSKPVALTSRDDRPPHPPRALRERLGRRNSGARLRRRPGDPAARGRSPGGRDAALGRRWRPIGWSAMAVAILSGLWLTERHGGFHRAALDTDFDRTLIAQVGARRAARGRLHSSTISCSARGSSATCAPAPRPHPRPVDGSSSSAGSTSGSRSPCRSSAPSS